MVACGYAPQSVVEGMLSVGTEYEQAYCYDGEKAKD